jgi:hypothetical protein
MVVGTMILRVDNGRADAILGAMKAIGLAHAGTLTDADRRTIVAADEIVFGRERPAPDALAPVEPDALAAATLTPEDAQQALRMLGVMSLVDGTLDAKKTGLVKEYATALDIEEDFVDILAEAAAGEVAQAAACIVRKNAESFPRLDLTGIDTDAVAPLFPYRDGRADPDLEARYQALEHTPDGSFGRAFYDHFALNGFAFPGNEHGLAEGFTTPHDSSHVLSSYSTDALGEMCVSTFIGAMHPDHPMAAEVLPVLFSWHLGIKLNSIANSLTGYFEPRVFWTAWDRGAATTVDVIANDWDFWGATTVPLAELREAYGVPGVAAELLA